MKRTLRSQSDYQSTILRNQLTSLVLYEAITTTRAKSKSLIAFANHFFNQIKDQDLTAQRLAHQTLFDKNAVKKVFEEIMPRYTNSATTFVKSYRVMPRRGDSASLTMIALIKPLEVTKPTAEAKKIETKTATKKTAPKPKTTKAGAKK